MADIIKTATRDAYGKALIELGHKDKNVIVMDRYRGSYCSSFLAIFLI